MLDDVVSFAAKEGEVLVAQLSLKAPEIKQRLKNAGLIVNYQQFEETGYKMPT